MVKPDQLWCFWSYCHEDQAWLELARCSGVAEQAGRPRAAPLCGSGVKLHAGTQLASVPHAWQGTAGQQMLLRGLLSSAPPPVVPTFI